MPEKAAVFENTYRQYLEQIAGIDLAARADRLGAEREGGRLILPFYGRPFRVSADGVHNPAGRQANFAVSVLLCQYVLQCPEETPPAGEWVTYREFKDAGPLVGYFATNTNKIIETEFSGNVTALEDACGRLNGERVDDGLAYDLSVKFACLPKIPVFLRFNDRDSEFPSQCSILYRQSAEKYLDMECLAIGGTFLAGTLIGKK